jgi:Tol biopolymer transport system component
MLVRVVFLVTALVSLATPAAVSAERSAAQSTERIVFSTNRAQNLYRDVLYSIGENGRGRRLERIPPVSMRAPLYSPDRRRVLFERFIEGRRAIFVASPDGSNARRVTPTTLNSSLDYGRGAFAPDGRRVAFTGYDPCDGLVCASLRIFVVGIDGRGLREVANRGMSPSWSPDGSRIAFSGTNSDNHPYGAFVVRLSDGRTWALSDSGHTPVWAPCGDKVAFSPGQGRLALCVASGDGSKRRCVRGGRAENVVWSLDSRRIAFQSAGRGPLAVADANGRRLRVFKGRIAFPLALSPNGRRVAYVRGEGDQAQLLVRNVDGRGFVRRLGNEPPATGFSQARWRGRRISYVAHLSRNDHELAVLEPDGTGLRVLTRNKVEDRGAAWSPDRRTIAFSRDDGFTGTLRLIDPTGRNDRQLTATGAWRDTNPAWSPDGREIAFVRTDRNLFVGQLMVVDVATRATRTVVTGPRVLPSRVSWSPDRAWIVFSSQFLGPGADLHLVRPNGNDFRRLFTGLELASSSSWSPDGSRIAFVGTPAGPPDGNRSSLFTIRPAGTGLTRIAHDANHPDGTSWSPDGRQIVFARSDPGSFDTVSHLVVAQADGMGERALTSNYSSNSDPGWAR